MEIRIVDVYEKLGETDGNIWVKCVTAFTHIMRAGFSIQDGMVEGTDGGIWSFPFSALYYLIVGDIPQLTDSEKHFMANHILDFYFWLYDVQFKSVNLLERLLALMPNFVTVTSRYNYTDTEDEITVKDNSLLYKTDRGYIYCDISDKDFRIEDSIYHLDYRMDCPGLYLSFIDNGENMYVIYIIPGKKVCSIWNGLSDSVAEFTKVYRMTDNVSVSLRRVLLME